MTRSERQICYTCRSWTCFHPRDGFAEIGNCAIGAREVDASDDTGITFWNDTCSSWEPRPAHYLALPPMPPEPTP